MTMIAQPAQRAQLSLDISREVTGLRTYLTRGPVHIDELCQKTGLPKASLSGTLALLELNGLARQVEAMQFVLAREIPEEYRVGAN